MSKRILPDMSVMGKTIECTSKVGTTVALIDAIITLTRLLDERLEYDAMIIGSSRDKYQPIRNALHDLLTNSPYRKIIDGRDNDAMNIIHDAAAHLKNQAPRAEEGVTFCYVTYNKCDKKCPTREECALAVCAACGETRHEHITPGGTRYGPNTLCGVFIPQERGKP